jgi:uncharacterized membrane protein
MIQKVELFLLVLSFVYCFKFIFEFVTALKEEDPEPITVSNTERVFLYLAIAYIITSLINVFIN